jgi:hypothetical protein
MARGEKMLSGRGDCATALVVLATACCVRAAVPIHFDTIALSGAAGTALGFGPGLGPGVDFSDFGSPSINNAGQVAFNAAFLDAQGKFNTGVFRAAAADPTELIARSGNSSPGPNLGADVNFSIFGSPVINVAGDVGFSATLSGANVDSSSDQGVFRTDGSAALIPVARSGSSGPGPNLEAGVHFSGFNGNTVFGAGGVAHMANVAGSGVTSSNNKVLFRSGPAGAQVFGRSGAAGPGPNLGPGVYFDAPTESRLTVNDAGDVAFTCALTGPSVTPTTNVAVFRTVGGAVQPIARESSPAASVGPGFTYSGFAQASINNAGAVAFHASFNGPGVDITNNRGLFRAAPDGTVSLLVRNGAAGTSPNLGPGVVFQNLVLPTINSSGDIVFSASLAGTGVNATNSNALFATTGGGAPHAVARTGAAGPGPGLGPGVVFSSFFDPVINDAGDISFIAVLTGTGVNSTNDRGIFTNAGGGTLRAVVREGDLFDVNPGPAVDLRTISGASIASPAGGQDGQRTGFNDDGLLALSLFFTDGSSGIFTAQVPEPGCLTPLVIMAALLAPRRGRAGRSGYKSLASFT